MIKRYPTGRPVPLESSALRQVSYNPKLRQLDVQFQSGKTYRYGCVDAHTYHGLLDAQSAGGFFVAHVRNDHPVMPVASK